MTDQERKLRDMADRLEIFASWIKSGDALPHAYNRQMANDFVEVVRIVREEADRRHLLDLLIHE